MKTRFSWLLVLLLGFQFFFAPGVASAIPDTENIDPALTETPGITGSGNPGSPGEDYLSLGATGGLPGGSLLDTPDMGWFTAFTGTGSGAGTGGGSPGADFLSAYVPLSTERANQIFSLAQDDRPLADETGLVSTGAAFQPVGGTGTGSAGTDLASAFTLSGAPDLTGGLLDLGRQAQTGKKAVTPAQGGAPPAENRDGAVDWLRRMDDGRGGWSGLYRFATWMANDSGTSTQINQVADGARGTQDPMDQIRQLVAGTHQVYGGDGSKVCRHYAMLFNAAASKLGYSSSLRVDNDNTHAWSEVTIGGTTYVVDPLNNIIYQR